ncbi:MAG: carboxypeptidase regulatory-like domain-containing protein [Terriglobia bacterium]
MSTKSTLVYLLMLPLVLPGATQYSVHAQNQPVNGKISGTIKFEGVAPKVAPLSISHDRACQAAHPEPLYSETGQVNANGTLPNVFIFIKQGLRENMPVPPATPIILDQRGCMFVPHVLGVMVGQPLQILNSDPTTHNVQSAAKENRPHNQSQQPGAPPILWKFNHPEIMITLKCNVHPWMSAYLGVVDNPFYAVTGKDGVFSLRGVPPGRYVVEAWTETFGTQEKKVTVPANRAVTADFMFKLP